MNAKKSLLLILVVVVVGVAWYIFSYRTDSQAGDQTATYQACETDSDCSTGELCLTSGPLIAGQPAHKYCYPAGEVAPL
jgi:hypothetical protein